MRVALIDCVPARVFASAGRMFGQSCVAALAVGEVNFSAG